MKMKKWAALAACGMLAASLALFGCSSEKGGEAGGNAEGDAAAYTLLNEGKLIVGTSPDYPPFENLVNGEMVGFEIDLMNAIAEKMGLEVEYKSMQFDGIVPAVAAGGQVDLGLSGFSITPERLEEVDFTESYYVDDLAIAVMKDSGITADNVDEKLGAAGVKIAVQSGTTGEAFMLEDYPEAEIVPYGNSTDSFAALQSGQVSAVCTNAAVVERTVKESYTDAVVVKSIATGEEYGIAVSKENPELLKAVNAALAELEADGTIADISAQWF
ncbi:MAG: amino acid ABC transporter substrate-binding protein [Eggerthellaceae bacterium]|nr:amino acid ABC transporter substrate-binding protein [Eggerthellaceae bacterium]